MRAARPDESAQLKRAAWLSGDVWYRLHETQLEFRRTIEELREKGDAETIILHCSRRLGKSFFGTNYCLERCIKKAGAISRHAAPTEKQVRRIIEPHLRDLFSDCPQDLRPKHYRQDGIYEWPNGSIYQVAGCELGGADRLLGTSMDVGFVDEAGRIKELRYLVEDVLMPQLITTDGVIILASTSPPTVAHEFVQFCLDAEKRGTYFKRTIFDAPHISQEKAQAHIAKLGGPDSSKVKREYFCEFAMDETKMVVPEWDELGSLDGSHVLVREHARPQFYQPYIGADFGFHDLTAIGFGYLDFEQQVYVQEDELIFERETTMPIAKAIRQKELQLWEGNPLTPIRIADCPEQQRADLASFEGFGSGWGQPPGKNDKDASVAFLRTKIRDRKILIHPRCKTTIRHLHLATWKNARDFERSGECGHFDALDQLRYVLRAIDWRKDPYPPVPRLVDETGRVIIPGKPKMEGQDLARLWSGPYRRRAHA